LAKHAWTILLNHPDVRDVTTLHGKRFRKRFRVPAAFFIDWLVPTCKEINVFNSSLKSDGNYRQEQVPFDIKLLICLRILARGVTSDDVSEPSGVSPTHCDTIFKQFIHNFSSHFKDVFITLPQPQQLKNMMEVYAAMGFPGCVGSVDCTHIRWWNCPRKRQNLCRGKEGFPTLAFQVLVDPSRRIQFVSKSFFGSLNDKNICDVDKFIYNNNGGMLNASGTARLLYKDVIYDIFNKDGEVITLRGGYFISDGGYPLLSIFVNPHCKRHDRAAVIWSEFLESIRKDVECCFGILKSRFRMFMYGVRLHEKIDVEKAFHTACILHNMLHTLNGFDIDQWEKNVLWDRIDPDVEDEERMDDREHSIDEVGDRLLHLKLQPIAAMTNPPREPTTPVDIPIQNLALLQTYLICHLDVSFRLGRLCWPRLMTWSDKHRFQMPQHITEFGAVRRALAMSNDSLYVTSSNLRIEGERRGVFDVSIGKGLFTCRPIKANEVIVEFLGEWIDEQQYHSRVEKGCGGYMISLRKGLYLDCYNFKDICKASMANSVTNAFDISTGRPAKKNCYLKRNKKTNRIFLVSTRNISVDEEILYDYYYDSDSDYPDVLLQDNGEFRLSISEEEDTDNLSDEDYNDDT